MIAQLDAKYIRSNPGRVFPRLLSYFFFEGRPLTTSGRWFNPITFAALRKAGTSAVNPAAEHPVFITGTGRSGTTILGKVLSVHPEIGFLNEPKAIWHLANPADDLIGNYTDTPGNYFLSTDDVTPDNSHLVKAIYSTYLKLSGTHVILDKYPEMIFRTDYINKLFLNPRFIFLHRNPWDTIRSTAQWSAVHGNDQNDWWGRNQRKWRLLTEQVVSKDTSLAEHQQVISAFTSQHDKAATEWIVTMNKAVESMKLFPDRFIRIGYENLTDHPEESLNNICRFIGVNSNQQMIAYGKGILKAHQSHQPVSIHRVLEEPLRKAAAALGYLL
ncbi:MAG TPA: sulfotransferase [Bacteroidia bacterium]|nr:sulfotransferase [Bacteroidia bacterium]